MSDLYEHSLNYAKRTGELELWRESLRENTSCKKFICDNATMAYINGKDTEFYTELIDKFPYERVIYVIAKSIKDISSGNNKSYDKKLLMIVSDVKTNDMVFKQDIIGDVHPTILKDILQKVLEAQQEAQHNEEIQEEESEWER